MGLNCLSSLAISDLKFSDESNNWLFGCCPLTCSFKDILQLLVIILNTIIDRDKL